MKHAGGRPRVTLEKGRCKTATDRVKAGEWSLARAGGYLGVSKRTMIRLVRGEHVSQVEKGSL
jgi:hypothetical protein